MSGVNSHVQVARAVTVFEGRRRPTRWSLAAACLIAAAIVLAPSWWWHEAVSAARWSSRYWPAFLLVVAAIALASSRRRQTMLVGARPRGPDMPLLVQVGLLIVV